MSAVEGLCSSEERTANRPRVRLRRVADGALATLTAVPIAGTTYGPGLRSTLTSS